MTSADGALGGRPHTRPKRVGGVGLLTGSYDPPFKKRANPFTVARCWQSCRAPSSPDLFRPAPREPSNGMINAADRLRLVRLNRNALASFLPRRYAPPRANQESLPPASFAMLRP